MWRGLAIWLALAASLAAADELLGRFRERLARTLKRVPNYTCVETIERWRSGDPCPRCQFRDRLRLEVALVEGRERFAWPGASRFEDTEIDQMVAGGAIGSGDFAGFASGLAQPNFATFHDAGQDKLHGRAARRYGFRVPIERSKYTLRSGQRSAIVAYSGTFWFDPKTLDLLRLEVQADNIPVEQLGITKAGTAIDYARIRIGASDFLLPDRSELYLAGTDGISSRNRTTYGNCRQYVGQSTLLFDEEPAAAAQPGKPKAEVELPAGLSLEVAFGAPIDAERAVRAGALTIPKGALLHGRIKHLRYYAAPRSFTEVAVAFTRLEFDGLRAEFHGRLDQAGRLFTAGRATEVYPSAGNALLFGGKLGRIPKGYRTVWKTIEASEENP